MPAVTRKSRIRLSSPVSTAQGRGGTVQRVQDVVRDAIVRLELPPGTAIDKAALCARLGVSRFPVSEALGRLAAEGFVEILPQRGTRVARIDLARLPAGDVHPPRARNRSRSARSRRARTRLPRRAGPETCASRKPCSPRTSNVRFHQLDLELHDMLLTFLGFDRVKSACETARGSLDRARLFMCTPERKARPSRNTGRSSPR